MAETFPEMSKFASAFAAEYKGFMRANGVRGADIASVLSRGEGYVSERVNGKRALDTNDVDALASLVDGWSGIRLMLELTRRAEAALGEAQPSNVTELRPRDVGPSSEDKPTRSLRAVAKKRSKDRGGEDGQG